MKTPLILLAAALLLPFPALAEAQASLDALAAVPAVQRDVLTLYRGANTAGQTFCACDVLADNSVFRDSLKGRYEFRVQDMPEIEDSAFVFSDAEGHPYYCFDHEYTSGMDWVLEELAIAAERKPVVAALRAALGDKPSPEQVRAFFEAMPLDIERFDASYRRLLADAAPGGDLQAARRAMHAKSRDFVNRVIDTLDAGDFLEPDAADRALLDSNPVLSQFYASAVQSDRILNGALSGQAEAVREIIRQIAAIEPRSKFARYLAREGGTILRDAELMLELSPYYRTEPERALRRLEERRQEEGTATLRERQVIGILEGRVLAEMGQWDAAIAKLKEAQTLSPLSDASRNAGRLIVSLLVNRKELEELLPLHRKGDAEIDARWDDLLRVMVATSSGFSFCCYDLFFQPEGNEGEK